MEKWQNSSFQTSTSSNMDRHKIDWNDHDALQEAFDKVRSPLATADNPGEPGDFDGAEGLECPDVTKWFLANFTTLKPVFGNGEEQVDNLASENGLEKSTVPCAPAVYSVAGGSAGPGTSGRNDGGCGHTGIILSCKLTNEGKYKLTYFHTYSGLLDDGKTSVITTKDFFPEDLKNTTFLDLGYFMI